MERSCEGVLAKVSPMMVTCDAVVVAAAADIAEKRLRL